VGTGGIARKFAAELPQTPRAELVAVGSRKAESADTFAGEFGGTAYAGYERLLADSKVDAVYNALPNAMHHPWTLRALECGKHVLCEKPMAANTAQAEEMFDAAQRAGRVLIEGFMYRCHPGVQMLIQTVRDGRIGKLKLIRTHFTTAIHPAPENVRYQPALAGGSLMDVGCYCINLARALAGGEPTAMWAVANVVPSGVDDYAAGILQFPEGALCAFTCGMTVHADRTTFIGGSEGFIAMDTPWLGDGTFKLFKKGKRETIQVAADIDRYALEAEAFAAAVQDGAPPWISKADTLGNMRVLDELRTQIGLEV
jgi:predicted dehydrogenase